MSIPTDFPRFYVPGHEKEMESLRELYWLHYPGSGPKATMWDMWLGSPSLWPAHLSDGSADNMRDAWRSTLTNRIIDTDGYVSTMQHPSIAHPYGWPFPFWNQGSGGIGWHFSFKDTIGQPWRQPDTNTQEGWVLSGASDMGIGEYGWELKLISPNAVAIAPAHPVDPFNAPFIQVRWKATGLEQAQPRIEWTTKDSPNFTADKRIYFTPVEGDSIIYTVIPMYKHPKWAGDITQLRVCFGNHQPGAEVTIHSLFTQYDTRQDTNSQSYVHGCVSYFEWTRDINFLRRNISRMRLALRYVMTEHNALDRKYVYNSWVGHDGRSGLRIDKEGEKHILSGHGIGDNYWDLLPFGSKDAYATIIYYDALKCMARIERGIHEHPEWNIPTGVAAFDPDMLMKHAADVKAVGNKLFWNPKTGRFIPGIDADGKTHDYGMTFLSLEAIYYDFATPEHAKMIMSWIDGDRIVDEDTSQGKDIYHWRFGPRSTTKRNIDFYFWAWSAPESIPWGGQVQDGGAVLGWSYHDLMARLRVLGADNAWQRLIEVIKWFDDIQAAGGYRKYYDGSCEGTLQGGGTAGGLGLDSEFFESVLVPQVMLDGFMGFSARSDGFELNPRIPSSWPELKIDRIRWQDCILTIRIVADSIEITNESSSDETCKIRLPQGRWHAVYTDTPGESVPQTRDGAFELDWTAHKGARFTAVSGL